MASDAAAREFYNNYMFLTGSGLNYWTTAGACATQSSADGIYNLSCKQHGKGTTYTPNY